MRAGRFAAVGLALTTPALAQQAPAQRPTPPYSSTVTGANPPDVDVLGGSTHRVTEEELRAIDYADPDRAAAHIPGVYVRSEDGYGLRPNIGMRGANSHRSRRITLLEDGVLQAYAPYSSPSIFSMTPMTRIIGIDVYRGPAAILYGPQTIGGAIDLRTRDIPDQFAGSADYTLGLNYFSRLHFHVGGAGAHFGVLLEGAQVRASGFQHVDFNNRSNGFDLDDLALRAFWRHTTSRGLRHKLSAKLVYQFERSNETYLGLSDADFRADPNRRYVAASLDQFTRHRLQVELREQLDFGARVRLTVVAYRSDVERVWYRLDRFRQGPSLNAVLIDPSAPTNASYFDQLRGAADSPDANHALLYVNNDWRYVSQGLQADGRYQARSGRLSHDARAGARLHYDLIDRHIGNDGWLVTGAQLVPDGLGRTAQNEDLAETLALSGYLHYALGIGPFTLAPGVRAEWMSMGFTDRITAKATRTALTALLPGGAVLVDVTKRLRLFGGVHRGFTPPLPQDAGTVGLETSVNYEVGGRFTSADEGRLELTGFFSDYDNMTSQCTLTAGCTEIDRVFNSGHVLVYGVESAAAYTFCIGALRLPVQASYTYTGSSFRTAFASADPQLGVVQVGDSLPYVPAHQASLTAGVVGRRFGLHLQGLFIDAMREEASQGERGRWTDAQWLLDAAVQVRVSRHITLFARGENLLALAPIVSRRPWGARPTRPIQAQLGARTDL